MISLAQHNLKFTSEVEGSDQGKGSLRHCSCSYWVEKDEKDEKCDVICKWHLFRNWKQIQHAVIVIICLKYKKKYPIVNQITKYKHYNPY